MPCLILRFGRTTLKLFFLMLNQPHSSHYSDSFTQMKYRLVQRQ